MKRSLTNKFFIPVVSLFIIGMAITAIVSYIYSKYIIESIVVANTDEVFAAVKKLGYFNFTVSIVTVLVIVCIVYIKFMKDITQPVSRITAFAQKVSKGRFSETLDFASAGVDSTQLDELGILTHTVLDIKHRVDDVLQETERVSQAMQEGRSDVRGNPDAFVGDWRKLMTGMNTLIEAFVSPIMMTTALLERISLGDIPKQITHEYKGDFNEIKNNLNTLIETMSSLLHETNGLILAVQEGRLDVRGNADTFVGDWRELVTGMNTLLEAFVSPIVMTTALLERISWGDIPEQITHEYKGDFNEIKNNLNTLIETMSSLLHETNGLILAVQEGRLDVRGNTDAFVGDWQELMMGINGVIDAFVAPITVTAGTIDRIAKGDIPDKLMVVYKGDFNEIKDNLNLLIEATREITRLAEAIAEGNLTIEVNERSGHDRLMKALNLMVSRLNAILQEIGNVTQAVQEGELEIRGNAGNYAGGWQELVVGINNVITAFVTPINVTAEYLDRLSKGELPEKLTEEYHGDFNEIKNNLNVLIDATHDITRIAEAIAVGNLAVKAQERSEHDRLMNALNGMLTGLNAVVQETGGLTQAVQEGRLDMRGNVESFKGGWRELVIGMNTLIEAFVSPIMMTTALLERISWGDIPKQITHEYKGDFNEIKNNLNTLIETMSGLLHETNGLILAVQQGRLEAHGNAEAFVGDWRELVVGINRVIDAFVTPIKVAAATIDRVAKGDIPDKLTIEYKGDFNEIKDNLNLLIESTREITRLAEEMAHGNLTVEVKERSEHDTLMQALNTMILHVKEVVANAQIAAGNVAMHSRDLSASAETISQGAAQQASSAEEVSASMQQMAANIKQNADNARQTEKIALQSAKYAEEGGAVVSEALVAMQQIAEKILIIEEIATQTRMLSLNATIEAARAQEHGRAFAVVAAEIRNLSDITKKAAEEINKLATSSLDVSKRAGEMLTTLVPSIKQTTMLVQEITAASDEQSTGIEHINTAIQQLDQATQQSASTVDELATASEELTAQARQLQSMVAFFRIDETAPGKLEENEKTLEPTQVITVTDRIAGEKAKNKMVSEMEFDMTNFKSGADERDDEFEKY